MLAGSSTNQNRVELHNYRVDVPFRTSHIMHLNASALFLYVQTLQSQYPSSAEGLGCRFGLQTKQTHRVQWFRRDNTEVNQTLSRKLNTKREFDINHTDC